MAHTNTLLQERRSWFSWKFGQNFQLCPNLSCLSARGIQPEVLGKKTPPFQLISTREWPNNHQSMKFEFPLNFDLLKSITFRDSIRYYFWYWLRTWSCNCASWLTMKPPVISQKVLYCLSTLMLGSLNMQWNLFVKATAIKA